MGLDLLMPAPAEQFPPPTLRKLRIRLRNWFRKASRPLPWRETRNPYYIWISEVMLQQTTVKAVVPYFDRFVEQFPTVQDLAAASEEDVLRHWEGLGYYSRGRNLRRGAIQICEQHNGMMPTDVGTLQQIPGIGRYTAGAIVSFAYDRGAPILEANTVRVYSRLLGYRDDPRKAAGQRLLWDLAALLPPKTGAGLTNQALMEVGSLVCRPQNPDCPACPLQEFCTAFRLGLQQEIPVAAKRPEITPLVEGAIAVQRQGRFFVRRRSNEERWSGLWDFPRCSVRSLEYATRLSRQALRPVERELTDHLQQDWGLRIALQGDPLQIRHSVTRYRIRLLCYQAEWLSGSIPDGETRWATPEELASLPLSVTARQFADQLKLDTGASR